MVMPAAGRPPPRTPSTARNTPKIKHTLRLAAIALALLATVGFTWTTTVAPDWQRPPSLSRSADFGLRTSDFGPDFCAWLSDENALHPCGPPALHCSLDAFDRATWPART